MIKIKLIRTGGFIPITKTATMELDWSADEADQFIAALKITAHDNEKRDTVYYTVEIGDNTVEADPEGLPPKYQAVFNKLVASLKIEKT